MIKFNYKKVLIIWLILAISLISLPKVRAEEVILDDLELTLLTVNSEESKAEIIWNTNYPTWGIIRYGTDIKQLNSMVENTTFLNNHEMWLSGLQDNKGYYFSLEVYDQYGRQLPTSFHYFKTDEEDDTTTPILTNIHVPFVSGNSLQFIWTTNENSTSCIFYGTSMSNLNKSKCSNSLVKTHDLYINNLEKNTKYYYRAYSEDSTDNGAFSVYYNVKTTLYNDVNIPPLEIVLVTYNSENTSDGKAKATINIKTNRPIEGEVKWKKRSNSGFNSKKNLYQPRSTNKYVNIYDLEPNTEYKFKFEIKDLFNQSLTSEEYALVTPPLEPVVVAITESVDYNEYDLEQDYDQDGLTNGLETEWGTDPVKSDTDGDGYLDGVEVDNCYNPLGIGKLLICSSNSASVNVFAYNQPRVENLQTEVNVANELKYELEQLFGGAIPVASSGWSTLVNSYIYGEYPVEAIYKAIIYSGKTVHPEISWANWNSSNDYQEYIVK